MPVRGASRRPGPALSVPASSDPPISRAEKAFFRSAGIADRDRRPTGLTMPARPFWMLLHCIGAEMCSGSHGGILHEFDEADGDGVDLFARGASGNPDADRLAAGRSRTIAGKTLSFSASKTGGRERTRDADEEVLEKCPDLDGGSFAGSESSDRESPAFCKTMRRSMRRKSVFGLYCEKSTPDRGLEQP